MKKKDSILKLTKYIGVFLICIVMIILFNRCEKEIVNDDDDPIVIVRGTDSYAIADCTPQDYLEGLVAATSNGEIFGAYGLIPNGNWFLDVPHSAVSWKTAYMGFGAFLTGKFSWFALKDFSFDETNPSNISFEAKVLLNSVVTSQILRDDGCLLAEFATDASYIDEAANLAVIKTTSASYNYDDAGYTVLADLTFLGTTHEISINLEYIGVRDFGSYLLASFAAEFQFNAISGFGLGATTVGDLVTVNLNLNLKKNL